MRISRICGAAGVAVIAATATATASASPTVSTDRECYLPDQAVRLSGTGFTPAGAVRVSLSALRGGGGSQDIQAAADGSLALAFTIDEEFLSPEATSEPLGLAAMDLTLVDQGASPETVTAFKVFWFSETGAAVDAWDDRVVRPRSMTRFRIYGMNNDVGKRVYAHYVIGGKAVKSVALGQLKPPCGDLNVRKRQFAFKPVPAGLYKVVFSSSARYSRSTPSVLYPKRLRVNARYAVD